MLIRYTRTSRTGNKQRTNVRNSKYIDITATLRLEGGIGGWDEWIWYVSIANKKEKNAGGEDCKRKKKKGGKSINNYKMPLS